MKTSFYLRLILPVFFSLLIILGSLRYYLQSVLKAQINDMQWKSYKMHVHGITIDGFNHFVINRAVVLQIEDTIATIREISAHINFSDLLNRKIRMKDPVLTGLSLNFGNTNTSIQRPSIATKKDVQDPLPLKKKAVPAPPEFKSSDHKNFPMLPQVNVPKQEENVVRKSSVEIPSLNYFPEMIRLYKENPALVPENIEIRDARFLYTSGTKRLMLTMEHLDIQMTE